MSFVKLGKQLAAQLWGGVGFVMVMLFAISANANTYQRLSDTGFYDLQTNSSYGFRSSKHYSKRNQPLFAAFSPQYPLWSDGAKKMRWIYLPAGSKIETSDPNDWQFPVGTKLWKEFSFVEDGNIKKIETRLLERLGDGRWNMQSFVWNEAQTDAVLVPEAGIKNHYKLSNGEYYDIPSKQDCQFCHSKAGTNIGPLKTPVLGFSALQLSDIRDANAIHGEALLPGMLTLSKLQKMHRISVPMTTLPAIPDSEKHPFQRRVFGYLHANCGHCHNEAGMAELSTTLSFYHNANATVIQQNDTYKTALGKSIADYLQPANSPKKFIEPGNAENSAILYRMTNEVDQYSFTIPQWHHSGGFSAAFGVKMPFVGTNMVDEEAVGFITEYINTMSPQ